MEDCDENTPLKENRSLELNPVDNHAVAPPLPLNIEREATDIGRRNPDPLPSSECDRDACLGCSFILNAIGAIVLTIMWLSHLSFPTPPEFQVKSLSFSSFNLSPGEITTGWNISFYVKNPKKATNVFYDGTRVSLLYNDEFISATDTASFYHGSGRQFWINATLGLGGSPVKLDPWIVSAIDSDKNVRKEVFLSVVMDARVSQSPGSTSQERPWIKVFCGYVKVEFLSETDQVGAMAAGGACTVNLEKR